MIQRIQTVFLILAVLLNGGVFFTPIFERAIDDPAPWMPIAFGVALGAAALLSLYAIFLYQNRKNQVSWVKYGIGIQFVSLGFSVGILLSLGGIGTYLWDESIGVGLVLLALIFQFLAVRYIRKDEKLVKSMDRIR